MSAYPRYAIYYVPARKDVLARFGAQTLGYDAFTGADIDFPHELTERFADWHDITSDPRVYGFHATLKAPFALAEGAREAELIDACAAFCTQPRTIPVIAPVVAAISGFTAIVPATPSPDLMTLAQDIVEAFDTFRAPLSDTDRARRKPDKLTAQQVAYLDRWGYPYVKDEFRFHMTLTGRLPANRQPDVIAMLQERFAAVGLATLRIDRLGVFHQPAKGARFEVIADMPLVST